MVWRCERFGLLVISSSDGLGAEGSGEFGPFSVTSNDFFESDGSKLCGLYP